MLNRRDVIKASLAGAAGLILPWTAKAANQDERPKLRPVLDDVPGIAVTADLDELVTNAVQRLDYELTENLRTRYLLRDYDSDARWKSGDIVQFRKHRLAPPPQYYVTTNVHYKLSCYWVSMPIDNAVREWHLKHLVGVWAAHFAEVLRCTAGGERILCRVMDDMEDDMMYLRVRRAVCNGLMLRLSMLYDTKNKNYCCTLDGLFGEPALTL